MLAGLLLIASFPDMRWWPLAFVALVPFEQAVHGQGWKRGLLLGAVLGFVLQSYLMFWANFFGPPAFLFLAAYRAYPYAFIGWGWATMSGYPLLARLVGYLGCWVFVEYYQTWGPFGCTWGMLSHTLARQPDWLQICRLGGPWSLSAVVATLSLVLAESIRRLLAKKSWTADLSAAWVGTLAILLGTFAYGANRLAHAPPPLKKGESPSSIQVGAIQVNMGRDIKWDPSFANVAIAGLEELTLRAGGEGSKLSIWPETSIPYRNFRNDMELTERFGHLARVSGSNVLVGSIEFAGDAANHTLNTAWLIGYQGDYKDRYDKQRLVPGGEYLPFENVLRPFSIFDRVMNYKPGAGTGVVNCEFKDEPKQVKLGVLICFESMLPSLAAQRVEGGAEALAISTNDGWFGESSAITHHFEMAIFRAVETARPAIQSGNTGLSGVIDAYGRVLSETRPNEKTFAVGALVPGKEITFYVRWGDYFAWGAGLVWFAIFVFYRARPATEGQEDSSTNAAAD